ncbi:putative membrane protein YeiH [Marinobacterium lacunae]|uniref:Putative membrane protein YeiH n=1 Tax=Marinobacterium lacunae TaxID=1232683 RepID=A0A081G2Q6_9GAMM|nr:putative sulfate exporter family transporter [Marinobacterium lacunae]KEA65061.1 putative membrane protein YeiH [Marinobacterium lacunae]
MTVRTNAYRLRQPSILRHKATRSAVSLIPGLILCAAVALGAQQLGTLALFTTLGPLTLAMLIGLIIGQRLPARLSSQTSSGTQLARTRLLRLGIVLYGLRISPQDLIHVGGSALLIDAVVVTGIFLLAGWVGTRLLKLELRTALLVGAGSAVCGAAAILAIAPALRAKASDIPVAIATVVLFGTAAMLLYPWLWTLPTIQHLFGGADIAFGHYLGATVHEVAQVAAAANALNPEAGQAAVITKLIRVMLLVPLILVVSAYFGRQETGADGAGKVSVKLPWFALAFMVMPLLNASGLLSRDVLEQIQQLDTLLLAMAMAALGLETRFSTLKNSGLRPLLLGALLFVVLVTAGMALTLVVGVSG